MTIDTSDSATSTGTAPEGSGVRFVLAHVDTLHDNPADVRGGDRDPDRLAELAASIRAAGMLQALTVIPVAQPGAGVALAWLSRPHIVELFNALARDEQTVTHARLDELPAGPARAHLRAILVSTGALPERDDRLATLERWIRDTVAARDDLAERRLLQGYGLWHHLRRLRRRAGDRLITRNQDHNIREQFRAAVALLDWLRLHDRDLSTGTQGDLDRWANHPSYRRSAHAFLTWAIKNRHASRDLTLPSRRWDGPTGPHDSEQRWNDARRLFQDTKLFTADRVAGLPGCSRVDARDTRSATTNSVIASAISGCTLTATGRPPCSPSPGRSTHRSWPEPWASASTPPSSGNAPPPATR